MESCVVEFIGCADLVVWIWLDGGEVLWNWMLEGCGV